MKLGSLQVGWTAQTLFLPKKFLHSPLLSCCRKLLLKGDSTAIWEMWMVCKNLPVDGGCQSRKKSRFTFSGFNLKTVHVIRPKMKIAQFHQFKLFFFNSFTLFIPARSPQHFFLFLHRLVLSFNLFFLCCPYVYPFCISHFPFYFLLFLCFVPQFNPILVLSTFLHSSFFPSWNSFKDLCFQSLITLSLYSFILHSFFIPYS